jgi:hypothetical protein
MTANQHSFARAKQVLSPFPHTHSKHTMCLPLHCIVPTKHSQPRHIRPANPPAAQPSHHHSPTPHSPPPHGSLPHPQCTSAASMMAHVEEPPRSLHRPHHRCGCCSGCHAYTRAQQPVLIHHQTHHTTCTYNPNNLHLTTHSHTCMPTNLHSFAHAKHVLSPLPHTHS